VEDPPKREQKKLVLSTRKKRKKIKEKAGGGGRKETVIPWERGKSMRLCPPRGSGPPARPQGGCFACLAGSWRFHAACRCCSCQLTRIDYLPPRPRCHMIGPALGRGWWPAAHAYALLVPQPGRLAE
jgi:hypothetical protein